jgi:hypothetical protein
MTDQELDTFIAAMLKEPPFWGMAIDHLRSILRANPDYPTTMRQKYAERLARSRQLDAALAPVIAELQAHGVPATSADYMDYIAPEPYATAIPILVKWLPRIDHPDAKEWIARCLTVRAARPVVPAIIAEFRRMRPQPQSLARWTVGNAIGFQLDGALADDALELAADGGYQGDQSEFVRNLWRLKGDARVFPLLVELLSADDYIDLAAVEALRHLGDPRARPYLERYLTHPEAWVRNQAKKGIAKLDRQEAKAAGRPSPPPDPRQPRPAKPERPPRPWPSGLPHTGLVALIFTDRVDLEKLAGQSESELRAIPGIGPKTIARIQQELRERGLAPLTE